MVACLNRSLGLYSLDLPCPLIGRPSLSTSAMELLPKYLNELHDSNKAKRCNAYKKLSQCVESSEYSFSAEEAFSIIRSCLKSFEDTSERCREEAVRITTMLLGTQGPSILDWVLPSVVTRIGVSPVAEESEEIRLLLLLLASKCMDCFPYEIGPRNYIDYFQVVLENCYKDDFPDLKKEACRVTSQLCTMEPKQIKLISSPLAQALRTSCLLHKHSTVRCEAARTLAVLCKHGAAGSLSDGKDEPENRTMSAQLFILCNDHSESVRRTTLSVISCALLDVKERQELHGKYIPHLLFLSTDSFEMVASEAMQVLDKLGKLYLLDNEDHRIDIATRRVTMKDIEWYGDDDYPDMSTIGAAKYSVLSTRPPLGTRFAVAEATRSYLEKLLSDVSSIDWVIPFSTNNRKAVALRILWNTVYHCEKNCVQFAERILAAVYKALRDDSDTVRSEAVLCIEILGKFLTPDQYLPFLVAKRHSSENEEELTSVDKRGGKTVILSSYSEKDDALPSLFSTAAVTTRCSILTALGYLIMGSQNLLTGVHAIQIVQSLTAQDLLESENEDILLALVDNYLTVFTVLYNRGFIASPEQLPDGFRDNPSQRTLDSILFYSLIRIKTSGLSRVRERAIGCAENISTLATGLPNGLYSLHLKRILLRHETDMPVSAFADLVLNATEKSDIGSQLSSIFLRRLCDISFSERVTDELQYFTVLEELLRTQEVLFSPKDLEELLRVVVVPLGAFHPGNAAHLFRKVAVNCVCTLCGEAYRHMLLNQLQDNDWALSTKILVLWSSASDSDDGEMRLACLTALPEVSQLPMTAGSAHEIIQSVLLRMDDSNDSIRLCTASGLLAVLRNSSSIAPSLSQEIDVQMVPLTRKVLVYLDDFEERLGIRPLLQDVLKCLGDRSPHIVVDLVRVSMGKHHDPTYCQGVLNYITENHTSGCAS